SNVIPRGVEKLLFGLFQIGLGSITRLGAGGDIGWKNLQTGRRFAWLWIFDADVELHFPFPVALFGPNRDVMAEADRAPFVSFSQFPDSGGVPQIAAGCRKG